MTTTPYQMAINNVAAYISGPENMAALSRGDGTAMDAFTASSVLSAAFCKAKEEVIMDIVGAARKAL